MALEYPDRALAILLYDNAGSYHQPLTALLSTGQSRAEIEYVDAEATFRLALAGDWDAIVVAYPVAHLALTLLRQSVPDRACILLYRPEEEEQAFALLNEQISDLLPLDGLRRLPLILRREWQLKKCQANGALSQQQEMQPPTALEGFGETISTADLLHASEEWLRLLLEHAPIAIAIFDREMNYVSVSRRWLTDFCLDEAQIIGRSHYDIFPDMPEHLRGIHQRCLQGAVERNDAEPFPRADGSLGWGRWGIHPWRNVHGEIGGIVLFSEIITERKQTAEAEREQRLLAEAMRDSLAVLTASLDVETVMQQILEFSARVVPSDAGGIVLLEGVQGRVAYLRGHTPEAEAFFKENPITVNGQIYQKDPDNQTYYLAADTHSTEGWTIFPETAWIRSSIGVQIILHGEPIGLLTADSATPYLYQQKDVKNLQAFARYAALALENAYHVDHLEQRVQERTAELEAAKTQVEAILNYSPDAILLIRTDLTIQQANRAFYRLFACEPGSSHCQSLSTFIHQEDRAMAEQLMQTVTLEAGDRHVELQAVRKNGRQFDAEVSVGLIKGDGLVCVIRDITARKAQERQLRYHASLQENVSDAVIVTDASYHIQSWNKAAERIYGWRAEETTGRSVLEVLQTKFESLAAHQESMAQLREQGWWQGEVVQQHQDGTPRYILGSVTLLRDVNGAVDTVVAINHDITSLKQAQQSVIESEARYRLLAENIFDLVSRHTIQGIFSYVSPSVERLLGYNAEEVIGMSGFKIIHPDQSAQMGEMMRQASLPDGQPTPQIFQMQHKAGHYLLLEISVRGVFSQETGELVEFISSGRDVTGQKRAEAALKASEEKFRQVAENFDHLLFIRSADNQKMLFINSAVERLLGIPRTQMLENPAVFLAHVHPDDLAYVRQEQLSPRNSKEGYIDHEYRFIRPDQQLRWLRVRAFPIKDERGAIVSRVGTVEDVTERKQAELALQASETQYRLLVETMSGGLVVYNMAEQMTYVNDRFCEFLDRTREELVGRTPFAHLDVVNTDLVKTQLNRRRELENGSYEIVVSRKDGQRMHLLASGSPLRDADGNYQGGFAVVTDITAQKEAEETLRHALAKEKELGELKSRFVSITSHEFRTPLATISATAETLLVYRERLDGGQVNTRLHKILAQVGHMTEMMDDVLQLGRIQAQRVEFAPKIEDLQALCCDIVEEFRSRPEYKERIDYDPNCPPVELSFDLRLMRHVISNLVANGLKYSSKEQAVTVALDEQSESVTLRVTDQGIGIPDTDLNHIFDPFHRARNVGTISGTGLGLSITKEAVDMHGGLIHIETKIDVGTTVTVTLPTNVERSEDHADDSDYR